MKGMGYSKSLGKFQEVGRDVRKHGKVEFQILSEGKGSKREKHRPGLKKVSNCNNRLRFVGKW